MKLKVCLGACAVLLCSIVFAQEQPKMSPEEKAQMEAMIKAATPGEAHKKLASMVGTWDAKLKMYPMSPGAPVQESSGVSKNKWVLGGRWIQQTYAGKFMGKPFSGIGYTGYDNVKKQYVGTWMDTMSTSVMTSAGSTTDDKTYEFDSSVDDPMTGKPMTMKEKMTVIDKNHQLFEMWTPGPDGKMMKMMEITYTRRKS
jgi:uncharacterized protein DUF1579